MKNTDKEMLHPCMNQFHPLFSSPSLHLAFTLSLLSQAQGRGMDGPQRDLNRTLFPGGGLMVEFCVCSRDQLELYPPEREKAKLQYASWGPQGNQLVSQSLPHLSDRCVVLIMHTIHNPDNV